MFSRNIRSAVPENAVSIPPSRRHAWEQVRDGDTRLGWNPLRNQAHGVAQMCFSIAWREKTMEDFTPSRATSATNTSCPCPGLKQGTLQEFTLFTGTTRQPCLCRTPVALAMSSCAVKFLKILYHPKKAILWINIHILKRRVEGCVLCQMFLVY